MSLQTNFLDLLNATSSPGSASGPSPLAQPVSLTISPSGPVPAHASLSARQAQEMGLLTIATCGRTGIGLSRSAALTQSWASRLQAVTALLGSTLYRLTWKDRHTPGGRSIFALRASGHRISVSGFTCAGWPTPVAHGASGGEYSDPEKAIARAASDHANDLRDFVHMAGWSTASARDWKDTPGMATTATNPDGTERERLDQLPRQAMLAGWATPQSRDHFPAHTEDYIAAKKADGHGMQNLNDQVPMTQWPNGPFAIRCAVQQTASGPVLNGSCVEILTDQNSGLLNPAHSAWLQGIPAEMVNCVRMAMRSIQKSPRRSSKRSGPK